MEDVKALDAELKGISFCLATGEEICKASISDCPISHASQISNPFLGLPLDTGKCESCGTGEPGQCEGHFGYVELPTPVYHPDHISELKKVLSLVCLKCLKFKSRKVNNIGIMEQVFSSCCEETMQVSINEAKTSSGVWYLELKVPSRSKREEPWSFLKKYGFQFRQKKPSRPLLPKEVMAMLKRMPPDTRKKLRGKGFFPQEGYIIQYLPVPPNCLSVPEVSDGISTMSTDHSIALLKKVLRQAEIIKSSRSGKANFESHEIEANDLQAAVTQYLQFRGTNKASRDVDTRFGVSKEVNTSTTKAWLEKMKTLFIRKGSGFSSRCVITGDPYKGVAEIGLPEEIAQKITFEERVNEYNMAHLQKLVDLKLCLTYKDGTSSYSLWEGSKGHTFLKPGQVVRRRVIDGDIVFINRPPTTHKHSLQALTVYIHSDHTVKINPLICGPLSADFDGDCVHLFYPQSMEAKAEVVELFSVEKQLLSSHTGNFNLQLATDALLSLKTMFRRFFLTKEAAHQLAMFAPNVLVGPTVTKCGGGPLWTSPQILQMTLPSSFSYSGERYQISQGELVRLDYSKETMSSIMNDIVTSLYFIEGSKEVMNFFNGLQPLLMDHLFSNGFSISLRDFFVPGDVLENTQENINSISPLLRCLREAYSESVTLQLDKCMSAVKDSIADFMANSSIGLLIDSKSESALGKVVQQMGYLGLQVSNRGKFYSETLLNDIFELFQRRYPSGDDHPAEEMGFVSKPLFRGLNPYQSMIHSISSREIMVRSSRGLTEPGTLFKNLMAMLRDVVMCYDGTVRNMCSNSVLQFEYGVGSEFCAGEPIGVLAATAMSNPAYKAVLDSSPNSNSSWEMMKDILLCRASFKNDVSDRRVLLHLKSCDCGRNHCQENAVLAVKNWLSKIIVKDVAVNFLIEYRYQLTVEVDEPSPGLVGHIHLNKEKLLRENISIVDILDKCRETIVLQQKQKKVANVFKRLDLSHSDYCSFQCDHTNVPCIQFLWKTSGDGPLEKASEFLVDTVCPTLLQTVIKGDSRVSSADIVWVKDPCRSTTGELAVDVVLETTAVKKSGDTWRVVMDSCLPVWNLIDTRRSIPNAIKQVEESLGLSCAFELAVQRLSKSVTTVTKGVLKDHLLLLGNSMTCTGSLIGFNASGIKALSKTFNIQVPFMNATLFTPRKHFERSAEKCHVDNLSSIVASCVWGKQVSVGTGSSFDILWGTPEAELNPEKDIDVYDFLHLVNSSTKLDCTGTSCLGAEVEDLEPEDEFFEFNLSPARESGMDKPTFEDDVGFMLNGGDDIGMSKEDAWSGWGKKVDSEDNGWTKQSGKSTGAAEAPDSLGWGKNVSDGAGDAWGSKVAEQTKDSETWGSQNDWTKTTDTARKESSAASNWDLHNDSNRSWDNEKASPAGKWDSGGKQPDDSKAKDNSWGAKDTDSRPSNAWGSQSPKGQQAPNSSAWGEKVSDGAGNAWGKKSDNSVGSAWVSDVAEQPKADDSSWGAKDSSGSRPSNAWGSQSPRGEQAPNSSAWGKKVSDGVGNAWGKKSDNFAVGSAWGSDVAEPPKAPDTWGSQSDWTKAAPQSDNLAVDDAWGSAVSEQPKSSDAWGSSNDWTKTKPQADTTPKESSAANNWGLNNNSNRSDDNEESSAGNWGSSGKRPDDSTKAEDNSWGAKDTESNAWGWGQKQSNDGGQTQWRGRGRGWGRGRGRGRDGTQGRGGEWKSQRPPRPDDGNALTAEERDALSEIETITRKVKSVLFGKGYNDGDRLQEDDQKFIVENVLDHHPDKAAKIGDGLDYIMVDKHTHHMDSRCFYAVSINGQKEDFSYIKSIQNFIRQKYPDKAEPYIRRYFRKKDPRPKGESVNSGSPQPGEESNTQGWDDNSQPSSLTNENKPDENQPDEAPTPNL